MNVSCEYNRVVVYGARTIVEYDTLSAPFFDGGLRVRWSARRHPTTLTWARKISEADGEPYFICNQQVMMFWWLDLNGGDSND